MTHFPRGHLCLEEPAGAPCAAELRGRGLPAAAGGQERVRGQGPPRVQAHPGGSPQNGAAIVQSYSRKSDIYL